MYYSREIQIIRSFFIFLFIYIRNYLESIIFVSGAKDSIQHPLIYKHPMRHDDTIMVALGRLSGQYLQIKANGEKVQLSKEETQYILGTYIKKKIVKLI